eukprot:2014105-Pleurochrysis_carterae.AAC.3
MKTATRSAGVAQSQKSVGSGAATRAAKTEPTAVIGPVVKTKCKKATSVRPSESSTSASEMVVVTPNSKVTRSKTNERTDSATSRAPASLASCSGSSSHCDMALSSCVEHVTGIGSNPSVSARSADTLRHKAAGAASGETATPHRKNGSRACPSAYAKRLKKLRTANKILEARAFTKELLCYGLCRTMNVSKKN